MNLQQLRYVVATAEHRTMTDAARSLYIAQPALSRAIRDLERELGMTLFARSGRGVIVTAQGRRVVKLAREALDAVHEIEALSAQGRSPEAELRIASPPGLEPGVAGRILRAYSAEHPKVRVHIVRCDGRDGVVSAIRDQRADLGLTDLPVPADLISHPLERQEIVLISPPGLDLPDPVPVRMLDGMPLVLPAPGGIRRREFDSLFAKYGVAPVAALETDGRDDRLEPVRAGAASLLWYRGTAEQAVRAGLVVRSLDPSLRRVIALVHARRRLPAIAQEFLTVAEGGSAA
ncbi:LysR family transcriptional regulator [Planomonospora sp. ID91781]|uniref:LysR family transcriptional regulator n=3 Tax=Planomonospora TaxID=1998 RepID=A0A161L9W7_9ACTN|nr:MULTISPECIES: LysR family transcriptional regulator [Planomonospora]MBG0822452.1 LysR family transcriptional regulator [Planomonospora sp. ID91781]GAT64414.1 lysR family transcriptional regulator [Planomonospora sphaerica]GGK83328.1 LysR family transcriptional regulator [Planomonospora parontospora]GGL50680.1 LysR family transcriptional regulator [Planomonospora parontospora subsp. antibiotica]GII10449.1 LysR family transcriptional regulator [Planomonospora parontospora subsp. parontospora]